TNSILKSSSYLTRGEGLICRSGCVDKLAPRRGSSSASRHLAAPARRRLRGAPCRTRLSVLWRAHLASPPFFRQVDWAPAMQTESARLLLNSNAGSPTEYPCVAYSMPLDAEPRSDFMGQLFRWPKDGHHHHYCFSFAGLGWLYIVSQHAGRHALAKHAL